MKKTLKTMALLLCAVAMLMTSSCTKENGNQGNNDYQSRILGKWKDTYLSNQEYDLYFKSFSFNYLYPYIEGKKGKKGIIDLIKNYDKYLDMLNQLPSYSEIFPKDEVIDIDDGDNSASEIWNKYSSPYIHKDHYKNEYWEYWEGS